MKGAARMIKETLDKKFGPAWHVVVGEGFGFEITHEIKNILYMFFGGSQAILLWKCAQENVMNCALQSCREKIEFKGFISQAVFLFSKF